MSGRQRLPGQRPLLRTLLVAAGWTGRRHRRHVRARPVPQLPARPRRRVPLRDGRAHPARRPHRAALARARRAHGGRRLRVRADGQRAARFGGVAGRSPLALAGRRLAAWPPLVGLLLGLAAARLSGPYLAGLTLALVVALPAVAVDLVDRAAAATRASRSRSTACPTPCAGSVALEQWQAMGGGRSSPASSSPGSRCCAAGGSGCGCAPSATTRSPRGSAASRAGRVKVLAFTVSAVAAGVGGAVLCFVDAVRQPGRVHASRSRCCSSSPSSSAALGSIARRRARLRRSSCCCPGSSAGSRRRSLPADAAQRLDGQPRGPRLRAPAHRRDGRRPRAACTGRSSPRRSPRRPRPRRATIPARTEEPAPRKVLVPTEEQR